MPAQRQRGGARRPAPIAGLRAHHEDFEMKNKPTVAVLAFLLGGFAADQF